MPAYTNTGASIGGSGKHFKALDAHERMLFFKIFLSNELVYVLASPAIKLSIIFFYRRVFSVPNFRRASSVIIALTVAWAIAVFLVPLFQCRPLAKYWNRQLPGYCINGLTYIVANQGVNIALDFMILILPQPMIWRLHRPGKDKAALSALFLVGA
ncbi:MAG: hypothetical protein Q9218_006148, partial [Villophora microphyllina]